jgi:hypothetical protein
MPLFGNRQEETDNASFGTLALVGKASSLASN